MKRRLTVPFTFAAVALSLALASLAQAPANAFLVAPGTHGATLDGVPLLPGTTVLQGETVTTAGDGVIVLAPTHGSGGLVALGGDATATVWAGPAPAGAAADQLEIRSGDARVSGAVTVLTPQGQVFRPASGDTIYVVNVEGARAEVGVLAGTVMTFNPAQRGVPTAIIQAGSALQAQAAQGTILYQPAKLQQLQQPPADAAVSHPAAASQSQ